MGRAEANSGTNDWSNWIIPKTYYYANTSTLYYYGGEMLGGWGQGGVAECVTTGACTCVLMSDAWNNAGYWAITGNDNDVLVQTTKLFQLEPPDDGHGNHMPIILKPIPVPYFISSSRVGDTISLELRVEAEPAADYQLGTCDCVSGYLLYTQTSTEAAPTDRGTDARGARGLVGLGAAQRLEIRRGGPRKAIVREHGARGDHHAFLDRHRVADVHEGVDLHPVADLDAVGDVGLLADDALRPDLRRATDVHVVPDGGIGSDLDTILDDRGGMDARAHAAAARPPETLTQSSRFIDS